MNVFLSGLKFILFMPCSRHMGQVVEMSSVTIFPCLFMHFQIVLEFPSLSLSEPYLQVKLVGEISLI